MKNQTPNGNQIDRTCEFVLKAPEARSVLLAGDFTRWQERALPMKPLPNGGWGVSVSLPPGNYQYRFVVDGQWRDDPECARRVPNGFGGYNMVHEVIPSPSGSATPPRNRRQRPASHKGPAGRRDTSSKSLPINL